MTRETILRLPQPLRICAQLVWPTGQHRPHAAIVDSQLAHCPGCDATVAVTVHGFLLVCAEGHQIGGAS